MAKISLTIEADSPEDLQSAVSGLSALLGGASPAAISTGGPPPAPPSGRRQRAAAPAKAEAPAPTPEPEPETVEEPEGDADEAALLEELGGEEAEATVSLDDLKKAMHGAIAKSGTKASLEGLRGAAGKSKLSELTPDQYGAAYAALSKLN